MSDAMTLRAMRAGMRALGWVSPAAAGRVAVRLFFRPRRHERPDRERQVLLEGAPLELRSGLAATAWGGDGPTVLLVHGWEGRGSQLGAFVRPLVLAGRRVVALDGPAHGDSAGEETNLLEFARALVAVEREVGPLEAVVAHSFGSAATLLALDIGLRPRRVVVIAGPASITDVLARFEELLRLPPRVAARFRELTARKVGRRAEELDLAAAAARQTVPALVVHDPDDAEVPYAEAVTLAAAWPGARLRTVSGLGHRRILRDPAVVREVVEFATGAGTPAESPAADPRARDPRPSPVDVGPVEART
ncbi:MAG: acetoin dehydrogenase subunit dihydrolipoyllysine-residue acetyltransferase [Gemmatimonadetes bacterium]|nr:acetoin dehydrogenase subunit dihydrolipoyllysine-residue acetyltransferase [Gemmatimonadota bacterium]